MYNGSPREALAQYKESSDKMSGHIQNAMAAFVGGGLLLLFTAFIYVAATLDASEEGLPQFFWWVGGAGVVALLVGLYQRSRYLELAPKVLKLREDVEDLTGIDPYTGRPSD